MQNIQQMTDYDLAVTLSDFMAAAFLRWGVFTDSEKRYFRRLEWEACNRFVKQQLPEEAADESD